MNKNNFIYQSIVIIILTIIILPIISCVPETNKAVKVTTIEATYKTLFVQSPTDITCSAISLGGDKLTYKWSCTDGTFSGEGQKVTWTSPNAYGDYHIMVIAQDTKGNSDQGTITITVVYNPDPFKCPSCRQ